jgi:hypothetical protein
MNAKGTVGSVLDAFTTNAAEFAVQTDESQGAVVSIWDMKRTDKRIIEITPENGLLINGYPNLTTDGLIFTSLPVFNFMPGDTLVVDNRLIDLSVTSKQEATTAQLGIYLDANNQYMLYRANYKLNNASGSFEVELHAKSKTLLMNVIGAGQ